MVQLYTAVGKYKLRKESDGRKLPIISVGLNECALTIEEMLIWSTLIWNIMTEDELRKIYDKKALGAGISWTIVNKVDTKKRNKVIKLYA